VTAVVTARGRRRTAAAALGLVGALGLFGLAAPAHAAAVGDVTGGDLSWSVSQTIEGFAGTRTVVGGATVDDATKVVTFSGGTGHVDTQTGAGTVTYQGSYTASNAPAGSDLYSVTWANPRVLVNADGTGAVYATVSSWVAEAYQASSGTPTGPTDDVKIVGLTDAHFTVSGASASLTATPDWAGVLEPGSQAATDLGLSATLPLDGKSFAPEFLGAIAKGIRAHFYVSGTDASSASNLKKQPTSLTATASFIPVPQVTVTKTPSTTGTLVTVDGTGFTAVVNPGDAGVYVAIAPSGGLPDVSTPEAMSNFLAEMDYVTPGRLATGAFTSALDVPSTEPVPGTAYSVYTWQAHAHSNTTQDTETPLGVLVALPTPAPAFTKDLGATSAAVVGAATTLAVATSGDGVSLQWQQAPKGAAAFTPVAGATAASLTVNPASTAQSGTRYRVVATNAGGSVTSTVTTLTVAKATAKATAKLSKKKVSAKAKAKKRAKVKVTVKATGVAVSGKVKVTFAKKGAKKKTKTVSAKLSKKGKATVRAPKLKKGKYKVKVTYLGTSTTLAKATTKAGKLKVTKK